MTSPDTAIDGGGDSGAVIRSLDWSLTPAGSLEAWPLSLKTTVSTLIRSPHPILLWWGPGLIQFYNDAFKTRILHEKDPRAMGQSARQFWQASPQDERGNGQPNGHPDRDEGPDGGGESDGEHQGFARTWRALGPRVEEALVHGKSGLLNARAADGSEWNYGYSPVFKEDGAIGGVLLVCTDASAVASGPGESNLLPAHPTESSPSTSATSWRPVKAPVVRLVPDSKRILIVEDNLESADMLGELLRGEGHEVVVTNDPGTALTMFEPFRPEIAILDIGLPMMDGYELAARIRELADGAACRLIAMTGYGQQYDRARSAKAGFANYLVKPVDLDSLTDIIDAL